VSFLALGAVVAYTVVAAYQLAAMREANERTISALTAATRSANAAEQALDETTKQTELANRAWIEPITISAEVKFANALTGIMKLTNIGKAPLCAFMAMSG
jgi:type II secretory pathway pseudopilin PulG